MTIAARNANGVRRRAVFEGAMNKVEESCRRYTVFR